MVELTQIPISKETRERLRQLSYKSETYDTLVNRIINFEQKFNRERDFHEWIVSNYQLFGFDKILESNLTKFPDLVVMKNGETLRIEIETYASKFIQHGHNPNAVDMVICILKDTELPVKVLEIENFYKISQPKEIKEPGEFAKGIRRVSHLPTSSFIYLPKSWCDFQTSLGWNGVDIKVSETSTLTVRPYPSKPQTLIMSRTPLRLPLGGGGTDLPEFYSKHGGFWISGAINKYITILLKKRFEQESKIVFSKTEYISSPSQTSHAMLRAILSQFNLTEHIELISIADLPSRIGLGSSGTFTVGVLNAIHTFLNEETTPQKLAEETFNIEREILGRKIGKQDQYASSFGGIKAYTAQKNGNVYCKEIEGLNTSTFSNWLTLFYLNQRHISTPEAISTMPEGDYQQISNLCGPIFSALCSNNFQQYGELVDEHWKIKSKYQPQQYSTLISLAKKHGAIGGKLVGAGGDGCILLVTPPEHRYEVIEIMEANNSRHIPFTFELFGSEVYSY